MMATECLHHFGFKLIKYSTLFFFCCYNVHFSWRQCIHCLCTKQRASAWYVNGGLFSCVSIVFVLQNMLSVKGREGQVCHIMCKWERPKGMLVSQYIMALLEGLYAWKIRHFFV